MPGVLFTFDDRASTSLTLADPDEVDQVIRGLLNNAAKYGGGAPITVSVALVSEQGPDTLRLRVAYAGPGIAAADGERLLERRAHGILPGAEVTGLGLRVSRELARANEATPCWSPPNPGPPISRRAELLIGRTSTAGRGLHAHAPGGVPMEG